MNGFKVENDRLRGLLREIAEGCTRRDMPSEQTVTKWADRIDAALSQQAEPAPAQDERAAVEVVGWRSRWIDPPQDNPSWQLASKPEQKPWIEEEPLMTVAQHERIVAALTRPAQTEQQPVATILLPDPLDERDGISLSHVDIRRLAALPAGTKLYAAPVAQTASRSDCEWCAGAGHDPYGDKCQHCKTAPQPEQSGLVGRVCGGDAQHNTVNVALTNPAPWDELRIGTPVMLVALSTQGPKP